jgi:hypothetical protein
MGDERPHLQADHGDDSGSDITLEVDGDRISTLRKEEAGSVKLPDFIDRLTLIGKSSAFSARWFPFAYEVVIMQWSAILAEQRKSGEHSPVDRQSGHFSTASAVSANKHLVQAASRSVGVAVASAPLLFEVIKQSLGFRAKSLFNEVLSKFGTRMTPPLIALDDTLLLHLEQVITMVADACIDSRNFDSWDLRQMSIDVNDSIVRFLRDLFSFLAPSLVHRLILAYLSRFLTKDGKKFTDRDSLIGLRCSWEITKLRLNAVAALVRFPDFLKINGPEMLSWGNWWTNSSSRSSDKFFDNVLTRYQSSNLPEFVEKDESRHAPLTVPPMRPHWLAEIIVDVCLLGAEHAEQYISLRSASLLHEMFWACSQESILHGISAPVASMFVTFLEKIILNAAYLSTFSPKSQLRKDVLLCGVFVLQSTPANLLRSLWRRLFARLPGKGFARKYFPGESDGDGGVDEQLNLVSDAKEEPDILGMISVLNLCLRTIEYEGSDDRAEGDSSGEPTSESLEVWRKEYLLAPEQEAASDVRGRRKADQDQCPEDSDGVSSPSRKWQAHDGSMVVINTGHQIVREAFSLLKSSSRGKSLLNPVLRNNRLKSQPESHARQWIDDCFDVSRVDVVLFVRAVTSLYLHVFALRESDIVFTRTFLYSAEVIKIFGIKLFLEAVGETLQHWMRVILLHCGARRAQVRIVATDLLELILRSTWESYGSFFRIRVPLLAVQTEVMERIVATAAARYYREQRRMGSFETFTNVGAEASLVPLWRTLDRMQKQPASQNIAFRGALIRIAGKLKKLYRAYVAARVLSFVNGRSKATQAESLKERDYAAEALDRASRINILRVLNASEGYSKQFLGFQGTTQQHRDSVAHFEAVEDALIDAADVFSPTELPEHRVAWLRMLAEFHNSRKKYAEEATCHFHIHTTLHLAARLHGSLWSNTPFLPWTDNIPDPIVYIDGDARAGETYQPELFLDWENGRRTEIANSFRRIFYRVANSIATGNNEWETVGSKSLFYGITFLAEYHTVSPWITLREMEEHMVEELEAAGQLFLNAGIVQSSRFAWSLATQYYAEKFNYSKLSIAYGNLAKAVVTLVPTIDTTLPQEVSAILGRFYRVWFHGGAPDDLR